MTKKTKTYHKKKTPATTKKDKEQDKQLMKLEKRVGKPEVKHYYTASVAAFNFDYNGVISSNVFAPAQGVGITQRIGNRAFLIGVRFRITLSGSAAQGHFIRNICFIDHENNYATVGSVLQYIGAVNDAAGGAVNSYYDPDGQSNFTVKKDMTYAVDSINQINRIYDWWIPVKRVVVFSGSSTTAVKNGVKIIFLTNGNANLPSAQYTVECLFTDE